MRAVVYLPVLLVFAAVAGASDDPTISLAGVEDLTPTTFSKFVNGGKHALVEFYAPWCGHCKRMTPEFKKLGDIVSSDPVLRSKVVVAKVNADSHRELGEKFDVKGFPTIKFFQRGKPVDSANAIDYDEARTSESFLAYIKKKIEEDKGFARVEELDTVAKKFFSAAKGELSALVKEAQDTASALSGQAKDHADIYIKYMQKAVEKGTDYLKTEKARLERILQSGSVNPSKVDEMSRKASVLGAFADEE